MPDRAETIEQIVRAFHRIGHALYPAATLEWVDLELTMAQVKALFVLSQSGPMSVSELGQKLRVQPPAASHTADALVRLGMVERYEDREDRRRTLLRLSDEAEALVDRLRQGRREWVHRWLGELTDDELAELLRALRPLEAVVTDSHTQPAA